jgi:hypothetical protein
MFFPTGITRGTDIKIKKNRGQVSYSCYTIVQWEQCVYLVSALICRFFEYVYQAHTRNYMSVKPTCPHGHETFTVLLLQNRPIRILYLLDMTISWNVGVFFRVKVQFTHLFNSL